MDNAYRQELAREDQALQHEDFETAFRRLERAQVPSQRTTRRHLCVHARLQVAVQQLPGRGVRRRVHARLRVAGLRRGDCREAAGRVRRIVASILFSRLCVARGNSGRARGSAFEPMPVAADLQHRVP